MIDIIRSRTASHNGPGGVRAKKRSYPYYTIYMRSKIYFNKILSTLTYCHCSIFKSP